MINKIKKSAATFLTSLIAFSGLVSAMDSSEANKNDSQSVVLPVQQQSLAPINITVINEESTAAKLLAATKIALLGTSTVGVGACFYKVYEVIGNTGNDMREILNSAKDIFDVTKTGTDDILKTFNKRLNIILETSNKRLDNILGTVDSGLRNVFNRFGQVLAALPEGQARQLISDIHNILTKCGNSVDVVNGLLSRLDVERLNGIAPATVEMINSLTESIKSLLKVDPEQGSSLLSEIFTVLLSKPNANVSSENNTGDTIENKAENPGLLKTVLRWYCNR